MVSSLRYIGIFHRAMLDAYLSALKGCRGEEICPWLTSWIRPISLPTFYPKATLIDNPFAPSSSRSQLCGIRRSNLLWKVQLVARPICLPLSIPLQQHIQIRMDSTCELQLFFLRLFVTTLSWTSQWNQSKWFSQRETFCTFLVFFWCTKLLS